MCTAFVSVDPHSATPVLLLAARDGDTARGWLPPGRHWPERPGVVGGRDLLAGGTWLAVGSVDESPWRMACLLNAVGPAAPAEVHRSRGELPLLALGEEGIGGLDLAHYDPFHLIRARPAEVQLLSWNGGELRTRLLGPGLHVVANDGLDGQADSLGPGDDVPVTAARAALLRPRLTADARPEPAPGAAPTALAWGGWLGIADDEAVFVHRPQFSEGLWWGTTSLSLVALGRTAIRYDFNPRPGDRSSWYQVDLGTPATRH
ncbi:hypothetical protein P3T37_001490 [Kitasatospora sp. MAA4]|uniref:NRDE family protein n=1 Tax=Kitasatospora sp. MAA4 TaxID=3035093 RepID=UPI0024770051|nr:NRDE family protein [Kitasatospora sp. MAA4]MDH6132105.1 hypothetical protein [Kitasatospora sp. MAA4]